MGKISGVSVRCPNCNSANCKFHTGRSHLGLDTCPGYWHWCCTSCHLRFAVGQDEEGETYPFVPEDMEHHYESA